MSSSQLRTSCATAPRAACSQGSGGDSYGAPSQRADAAARRALLAYGGPRDVLARIVDGDPLGLRALVARTLAERCLLLDADRVHLRALALVARHATGYRGRPGVDELLQGLVERAVEEVLDEELEHLDAAASARPGPAGAFSELARPLGLAPDDARRACARFGRLPRESRAAFFQLVLERAPLDELTRRTRLSAPELARRARRALLALLDAPGCAQPAEVPPCASARGMDGGDGALRGSAPATETRSAGTAGNRAEGLP